MSYEKELAFAKNLALEAGGIMSRYFKPEENMGTTWKGDNTPLTVADTAINRLVIDEVKAAFPEYGVLGEEESYEETRDTIWVVDPVDGTVPFSAHMPLSTFCLALVNRSDGQPVVGVVYDPWLDELYHAVKGGGAFMNDRPIRTSSSTSTKRAYFALGTMSVHKGGVDYDPAQALVDLRAAQAMVLSMPAGAYLSNRVASGQFAGQIIGNPEAWDIAASALLVKEAGGTVTDLRGRERRYDEAGLGCILAANSEIFEMLLAKTKGRR